MLFPFLSFFSAGVLAFKFPESPTLKSTCALFVSQSVFPQDPVYGSVFQHLCIGFPLSSSGVCGAAQTELMSHCEDVPAVRDVLQEDGLLLFQTLLEVRHGAVGCFPLHPEVFYFSHTMANYQQLTSAFITK